MLILTRRKGQSIFVDESIKITFLGWDDDRKQGKIGIDAPDEMVILREELKPDPQKQTTYPD